VLHCILHCINIILYDIRKTSHCTARFIVLLALHCIFIQCRQYDIEYDIVLYTATLFTTLHAPSDEPSAHPAHRKLVGEDATIVSKLVKSGTAPREIRTYLHNHSDTFATQRDIYNRIAATRRDLREGQSSIQALVDQLDNEGFWCRVRLDPDNRLTAIFLAHPDSVAYLQCNPDVLILDCTYKTNKHGMPLLDMVGVDSSQRSFCIAFAFLSGKSEEDYSWALQHLRSLYQRELPSVI
jgi:hypothetical protein